MESQERQDRIHAFLKEQGKASWADIRAHCERHKITENPNTLNFDLSRLRFSGKIYLDEQERWSA